MTRLARGTFVQHPSYGRGTVMATRSSGHESLVSFGKYSLWVPSADLNVVSPGLKVVRGNDDVAPTQPPLEAIIELLRDTGRSPKSHAVKPPRFRPVRETRPIEDAIALESFRLGIVPVTKVAEWTVGRDAEVGKIREFLRDPAEGAILIEGPYGSGKSHLMQYLEYDALHSGFAVAGFGLEPSEATAAFPSKAWAHMTAGFRARLDGSTLDFRGFWREVARRDWRPTLGGHPVFCRLLERVESGKDTDEDWDWVEARESYGGDRPTLHAYSTCANIYCNLISATGRAAAEVLGLEGLLILIDEAEVARSVLYRYQALRGINFFQGLVLMANDDEVLLEESLSRRDVTTGEMTGLVYSGHNPMRYTSGIPSHVKVAFALTPGSLQGEFSRVRATMATLRLEALGQDHMRTLFDKICDRFESVVGLGVSSQTRSELFRLVTTLDRASTTRGFIKATVEILDFLRFYPDESVEGMVLGAL